MDRDRLTITLRKSLLRQIDAIVDGTKIRNRSHAIEYLLTNAFSPEIKLAVILAGGQGVKMRPLTYEISKPMIPIQGRPLMEYTIDLLKKAEINRILVALGPKGKDIRNHFGDGSRLGLEIIYSEEEKPLGTAGPLQLARNLLTENFLAIHGDILAQIDLKAMIAFHQKHQGVATMALTSVLESAEYGIVKLEGDRVTGFLDRPPDRIKTQARLTNAGIYIFSPAILDYIPKRGKSMLEDIFPKLVRDRGLYGYSFSGQWFDITTTKEYERAIKEWGKTSTS